ncbi:hypothetical protein EV693_101112 [Nicoletella semolina]|uniref:DUF4810 domain-containing protein n=1 Tax=Nicoletella semolina TaxID=271160 RepID=A0A4V2SKA5_9PAST|nr:DUF4810 domain-containing protein [Nicoletella semolina]MDH2924257.1 hypothetical protein [Nicoletella semolina]TCP18846.1 hypothetical protein EV693_101112 [Nicoletella semolina]
MKGRLLKKLIACTSLVLLAACGSRQDNSLYYWGNYNDIVYSYYEDKNDLSEQEQNLRKIIEKAQEKNKLLAPGIYGHLGLLLAKQGRQSEAQLAFEQENTHFPEARQFIQFLQKVKGKK